ncbi:MAG: pyridoxal-phosphate dependent enzyme, partial [Deltaproteobacteria bacterium]|nr:pyridoxal-phosphate dependent enzyme [Deltaproteobacteria bacterium]
NRLCSEIAGKYGWAFVNINIRPYYAEGSKSFGHEIAEQLGWKLPQNIVVPMAGGSLITKIAKSFKEFKMLGLVEDTPTKVFGAQASGCSPIVNAVKGGHELIKPVHPDTIAKSLAIGNPADGYYSAKTMINSGGWGEDASDDEIISAMRLLAETEGIFAETAGGVTLGSAIKLLESGRINKDESIVLCITGNGLKTQEALYGKIDGPPVIEASLKDFDSLVQSSGDTYATAKS